MTTRIKSTANLSNGNANKQPNTSAQKHINMLWSLLFKGTYVTPENEEYMYSINSTEIKKSVV